VGTSGQSNAEFGCSYGGKLYCLGSFTGAVVLLYNKDMFDAAGLNYPPTWLRGANTSIRLLTSSYLRCVDALLRPLYGAARHLPPRSLRR